MTPQLHEFLKKTSDSVPARVQCPNEMGGGCGERDCRLMRVCNPSADISLVWADTGLTGKELLDEAARRGIK